MRRVRRLGMLLHRCARHAIADDVPNVAQSAAYSAIFALFPALLVVAAVLPMLPEATPVRAQAALLFRHILPADVLPLLSGYLTPERASAFASRRALIVAMLLSLYGCSGVLTTVMEGFRRAHGLSIACWPTWWQRRQRALLLVPVSLLPLGLSSLLVVFGHFLALEAATHAAPWLRPQLVLVADVMRWVMALAGSAGLIAVLYKLGVPGQQLWRKILPGAFLATALWLTVTFSFGWYVTRFANYSRVYGSLGAGVALLVWLFLTVLTILIGAEFNGQLQVTDMSDQRPAYIEESAPGGE